MKIKLNIIRNTFIFAFTACVICAVLCFNNGFKENTVYAQENLQEAAVLASGACGTGLTWNLTDDGTLRIEGEGAMSTYSNGTAPWYSYADNITARKVREENCYDKENHIKRNESYGRNTGCLLGCSNYGRKQNKQLHG